ncbi:MAG: AmmeMemoRadiSam system radical SAM enzyme [Thermaerobacterales bacterium]
MPAPELSGPAAAPWAREAMYYERLSGGQVRCTLCPKFCRLSDRQVGACRVRYNDGGHLHTYTYGRNAVTALDPVEKKPLYHFYPGSTLLSLGTVGCNFGCTFCQNWMISQRLADTDELAPESAVAMAAGHGDELCVGLCYTYTEPVIWYEYVLETAAQAQAAGLRNVLKTNGYICRDPLTEWLPFIDAMNIDLKAFTEDYYQRICKGTLAPVMDTIAAAHEHGCHIELTTMLIPGENDDPAQMGRLAAWVANISPDIPLHISRYYPDYQMTSPPTGLGVLERAREAAQDHLHYVYLGNVWGGVGTDTHCKHCRHLLIRRDGLTAVAEGLDESARCRRCRQELPLTGRPVV